MDDHGAVMIFEKVIDTPVGVLTLVSDGECLNELRFGDTSIGAASCPLLEQAERELKEYFGGRRREFTITLSAKGTAFQKRVWDTLRTIGYGETATYADIAERIGNPKACRAVGNANNRNPIPIIVPCHRVIGKNGKLVGYAGGLEMKEALLRLECGEKR